MPKLCVRQEDNWYPALLPILEISTRGLRYNEDSRGYAMQSR